MHDFDLEKSRYRLSFTAKFLSWKNGFMYVFMLGVRGIGACMLLIVSSRDHVAVRGVETDKISPFKIF